MDVLSYTLAALFQIMLHLHVDPDVLRLMLAVVHWLQIPMPRLG